MELDIYQVDAFTSHVFGGNPAAVVPLTHWLPDHLLQSIALENNLSETAFFRNNGTEFLIRWFTPTKEVDLCGHATLASAHVLFHHLEYLKEDIIFETLRRGELKVTKTPNGLSMDFPKDVISSVDDLLKISLLKTFPLPIVNFVRGTDDLLIEVENEDMVRDYHPDLVFIRNLPFRGLILTAAGQNLGYDFVSRCFFPRFGIDEDPVTGSAHTLLAPYWSQKLNKSTLKAGQISLRTGILNCTTKGHRVLIEGHAVTFMKGQIFLP